MPVRARGVCLVCGQERALRWHHSTAPGDQPCWTLRRHNVPGTGRGIQGEICEGSGCDPIDGSIVHLRQ